MLEMSLEQDSSASSWGLLALLPTKINPPLSHITQGGCHHITQGGCHHRVPSAPVPRELCPSRLVHLVSPKGFGVLQPRGQAQPERGEWLLAVPGIFLESCLKINKLIKN